MKIKRVTIQMHDMRFYAYHGVLNQESVVGAWYTVNLDLVLGRIDGAIENDCLEDTVNYADVYACLRQVMEKPSKLIEHVAGRIARMLLDHFPLVMEVRVELTKEMPPINALETKGISVELVAVRND